MSGREFVHKVGRVPVDPDSARRAAAIILAEVALRAGGCECEDERECASRPAIREDLRRVLDSLGLTEAGQIG